MFPHRPHLTKLSPGVTDEFPQIYTLTSVSSLLSLNLPRSFLNFAETPSGRSRTLRQSRVAYGVYFGASERDIFCIELVVACSW